MIYTTVKDYRGIRIVTILVEYIQFNNYEDVFDKIRASISDEYNRIVIDFTKVKFLDSLSLGMLVPILLFTRRMGGDVILVIRDEKMKSLFGLMRLDSVIQIMETVEEAAEVMQGAVYSELDGAAPWFD